MFLRFLSDRDEEEQYWPFVLRLETMTAGILSEAVKHVSPMSDEQAKNYFENCFACCFSSAPETMTAEWWGGVIPSIEWFWSWFDREFPYILKETRRLASEESDVNKPDFDREKIHDFAHKNESFHQFLERTRLIQYQQESPKQ